MPKIHKSYYKNFIHQFRESMIDNKVSLVYEGEISQQIVNVFSKIAEAKMDKNEHEVTKRRVYHVMVECLQNICKHGDEDEYSEDRAIGKGILLVGNNDSQYMVTTGNLIDNENVESFTSMLDRINSLSPDEIKATYKKALKESVISDKGGAGLGFIDMVKKTGNPVEFNVKKVDDNYSFLAIASKVDRIVEG